MSASNGKVKNIFTTGQVAEICKVSQQTVIRLFDSGKLGGYRVPGSKFRRIPLDALVSFMKSHGIPIDQLHEYLRSHDLPPIAEDGESALPRLLIVGGNSCQPTIDDFRQGIEPALSGCETATETTVFSAVARVMTFRPSHLLVLNVREVPDVSFLLRGVQSEAVRRTPRIVCVFQEGQLGEREQTELLSTGRHVAIIVHSARDPRISDVAEALVSQPSPTGGRAKGG